MVLTCENRYKLVEKSYKEILMTRFSRFSCLYLLMLPWQRDIRQLNHQNSKGCIVSDQGF